MVMRAVEASYPLKFKLTISK